MQFQVLLLMYLGLSKSCSCFSLNALQRLRKPLSDWKPVTFSSAWIALTTDNTCGVHTLWRTSKRVSLKQSGRPRRGRPRASALPGSTDLRSHAIALTIPGEGQRHHTSVVAAADFAKDLLPEPADTVPGNISAGAAGSVGSDSLEPVEIDATLEGISRDGLLQLLRELQQHSPELFRQLSGATNVEELPTERLRKLVQKLLDIAEAADAGENANEEAPSTSLRQDGTQRHKTHSATHADSQEIQEQQPQPQQEEKQQQREKLQHKETQEHDVASVPLAPGQAIAQAAENAVAAASSAAVEAQQLVDIGKSKTHEGKLFPELQEHLQQLSDADVWDLLITMGPILEALLPQGGHTQQQEEHGTPLRQQNDEKEGIVESLEQLLDVTKEERQSLAAEAAIMRKFVEEKAGNMSQEGRRELLLTLLAVAEAEVYCPVQSEVRHLLGLHCPHEVAAPDAAASAAVSENTATQEQNARFGGLSVVAAWRRLLQLPENALEGESPLSAAEVSALSDREIELRYARVIKQARKDNIRASLERCQFTETPEFSQTVVRDEPPAEVAVKTSYLQSADRGKSVTGAGTSKTQRTPQLKCVQEQPSDPKPEVTPPDYSATADTKMSPLRMQENLSAGAARFAALGLNASVSSAAAAVLGGATSRPTQTQRMAIPNILKSFEEAERKSQVLAPEKSSVDCLVALRAHTGSGKTLCYLLPLMQVLQEQEMAWAAAQKRRLRDNMKCTDLMDCRALAESLGEHVEPRKISHGARGPRALIVCHSRPLTSQVASAAAALAKHTRLSVGSTIGGVGFGRQLRLLRQRPVDILIGTPERLLSLTRIDFGELKGPLVGVTRNSTQTPAGGLPSLEDVQFCILDEADASWLGGFRDEIQRLLLRSHFLNAETMQDRGQERMRGRQKVLLTCTATPNSGVEADICELLQIPPTRVVSVSGGPHFPPMSQLRHEMIQVLGADRFLLLLEQLKAHPELRAKKVLVFCNTVDSCRACYHHLKSAGLPAEGYDGSLSASAREKSLISFQEGSGQRILVATDSVARGLHINGVEAVINVDFPPTVVEYLHRAGRTGRLGSKGFVLSLVSKKDAVVAANVRASLSAGASMEELNAQASLEVYGDAAL
ncbi:DEAD/DEAH box helicase, putative [Eimeria tenella]|uniref:DEAD/DEAH box helicase, putative n=1 Tax=Eimeria tenella TaxID=5802 RepID=U6KQ04_EIMTE|nr:DEAD/DEAH box helicase, putative [Eimeria tenella]CDJ38988.1 DEAD/DEAH box helicase, putative [Eimeria tenella]|eukprot:XP_013229743.1 DEAD/DEAH box helicase, putative [Eimeria tenella]